MDVRLLVPGASDIPTLRPLTQAGYRPLLEAGVRVFEWNGPMLHAKSAVADGRWTRVGSSNLNVASWMGNYELDVAVEDAAFAAAMQNMYEQDLSNSTEIVLSGRRVSTAVARPHRRKLRGGSMARAAAGALRIGNTVGAAMGNRRVLGPAESGVMTFVGLSLVAVAVLGFAWPRLLAIPIGLAALWMGVALLIRAQRLRRAGSAPREQDAGEVSGGGDQPPAAVTAATKEPSPASARSPAAGSR